MNTILCIDTASDAFALAVDRDGDVRSVEVVAGHDHSRLLLPAVSALLAGDKPDAILVVIGPGAYAGVRVGIATAEGLSIAMEVPVYSIGTIEAARCAAALETGTIIHPAGRGEFAVQAFEAGTATGPIRTASAPQLEGLDFAGAGAGAFGGTEISPRQRCEAALRDRASKIRSGELEAGAEAFYLREPSITLSRRQQTAAS